MFDAKKMGKQIAQLRTGNRYTQEQLAEILKVSPQAVSKWENGKAAPEIPMLCQMSELFHCSIDRILDLPSCALCNMNFDYEFLVKPRVPAADYTGPEWPKSISSASLLTALKLFFGLEQRRDVVWLFTETGAVFSPPKNTLQKTSGKVLKTDHFCDTI